MALFLAYRANGIARQSMEAQSRAWVAIDNIEPIGFRMQNGSPRFVFKVAFVNMGSTPAVRFRYFAGLAFGDDPKAHIDETVAQFLSGRIDWVECDLFPDRPFTPRVSCDHDGEPQKVTATHLYIAAAYRTVFSRVERFTVVMFRIHDSRRGDHLIDYSHPPFGDHISVGAPEQFAGLVS
ncbi:hypothetical protein [Sphingopyxis sp. JAI128]|uniref:hypothetical protein n=1 Tax=Sphingopyxis sp. JAI128 TaxID=2723066 RepID=UPI00161D9B49|nr:hypothetical protein [Sphingopyxis sp. JAI128]MBB6425168.1 hypothetical protein [Sphingopyxis sp. JAI128]